MALVGEGESGPPGSPLEFLLSVLYRNRAASFLLTVLCVLLIVLGVFFDSKMGQTLTTPLSLTLGHWRDSEFLLIDVGVSPSLTSHVNGYNWNQLGLV